MSYLFKSEYEIIPQEPFAIRHNCSGCGCKTTYLSTGRFRVNANGKQLDIWLIYQCEQCKHTYNLALYERIGREAITPEDYQRFMENDAATAFAYGLKRELFSRNKAEIAWERLSYGIHPVMPGSGVGGDVERWKQEMYDIEMRNTEACVAEVRNTETYEAEMRENATNILVIHNPYEIKVRCEKALAEVAQITVTKAKDLLKNGTEGNCAKYVGKELRINFTRL
jgi:hypothetical protein